jgi:hypothetical protein
MNRNLAIANIKKCFDDVLDAVSTKEKKYNFRLANKCKKVASLLAKIPDLDPIIGNDLPQNTALLEAIDRGQD